MRRAALVVLVPLWVACTPAQPTPAASLLAPGQRVTVGPAPSTTPAPAPPAAGVPIARATFTSPFTPTPAPYDSRGLGLSERDWPRRWISSAGPSTATLWLDGRVAAIHEDLGLRFDFPNARDHVLLSQLPGDAAYLRTYRLADGRVVDLFTSPSLARLFPSATWRTPGQFAAIYRVTTVKPGDERVTSYDLVLGEP